MSKARGLADLGNVYSDGALSNRNLIINGAMNVAQRGVSKVSKTVTNYDTVDRFRFGLTSLGTWTETQESTGGPNAEFPFSAKYVCTTANASPATGALAIAQQSLEGQNLQHFKYGTADAMDVTLSFWVKSNKTGTYTSELSKWYSALRYNPTQFTVSVADTWERKIITISGDVANAISNDNGEGLAVLVWLGAGSTYTSGTYTANTWHNSPQNRAAGNVNLADTIGNYFQITGVQLEVGDTATPFEHRSFDQENTLCKRYFQRYGAGATDGRIGVGGWNNSTSADMLISLTHEMRVTPTVSAPSKGRVLDFAVAWYPITSFTASESTSKTVNIGATISGTPGAAQGDIAFLGGGGGAFDYQMDAEL